MKALHHLEVERGWVKCITSVRGKLANDLAFIGTFVHHQEVEFIVGQVLVRKTLTGFGARERASYQAAVVPPTGQKVEWGPRHDRRRFRQFRDHVSELVKQYRINMGPFRPPETTASAAASWANAMGMPGATNIANGSAIRSKFRAVDYWQDLKTGELGIKFEDGSVVYRSTDPGMQAELWKVRDGISQSTT